MTPEAGKIYVTENGSIVRCLDGESDFGMFQVLYTTRRVVVVDVGQKVWYRTRGKTAGRLFICGEKRGMRLKREVLP